LPVPQACRQPPGRVGPERQPDDSLECAGAALAEQPFPRLPGQRISPDQSPDRQLAAFRGQLLPFEVTVFVFTAATLIINGMNDSSP